MTCSDPAWRPAFGGRPDPAGGSVVRVVINRLSCSESKTGVGHYTAQLLRCLPPLAGDDRIDAFPQGWVRGLQTVASRVLGLLEPRRPPLPSPTDSAGGAEAAPNWRGRLVRSVRRFGRNLVLGKGLRGDGLLLGHFRSLTARRRYDLYHEPNFIPLPCDLPTVLTLHDLSVVLHPEWHPADRVAHYERGFRTGLERAAHILTVTEFARQEIIDVLGVPPQRVTVTPNGVRPGLRRLPQAEVRATLHKLGLPPQYLLYLGTLEPRKNVLMLLRVYCSLPSAVRRRWPLVLVGRWGWNTAGLATYLENEARHHGVLHLGYVRDDRLAALYNGARALVFPSFYEGFGLPPMEMLACGGAVLASTAGALVETIGGRAHLIDPHDIDGWRTALLRITQDDEWWQALRLGAEETARPFTWERCAAATLAVYRQVCGATVPQTKPLRKAG
jgi:alpha-1,3-rhamnosyl/mannosyltransferase